MWQDLQSNICLHWKSAASSRASMLCLTLAGAKDSVSVLLLRGAGATSASAAAGDSSRAAGVRVCKRKNSMIR